MVEVSIPTLQMIGFGPPVDKRGKPTGPIAVESDRRSWATIRNYWYAQNEWHHELLFYIGKMFDRLMGISPNYRYWWHSAHRLYYARIGEKKYRPLTDDWERYKCVFSPDSRYLAGVAIGVSDRNVSVFEMPSGRRRDLQSPHAKFIGWYPDSRRLWFGDGKHWYQLNVVSWQVRKLNRTEASALQQDWDLLNPRVRYVDQKVLDPLLEPYDGACRRYAYSRNGQVRIGAFPCWWIPRYERADPIAWRPQTVWVEWRNGKRVRLWQNQEQGIQVTPSDVSDDGRWAIVEVARMDENLVNVVAREWVLFSVAARRIVRRFRLSKELQFGHIVPLHFGIGSVLK
jgi:hypothetical protein